MALMFCPNCGAAVSERISECPSCGQGIAGEHIEEDREFEYVAIDNGVLICYRCISAQINIPEGVEAIAENAFRNNEYAEIIVVPQGVRRVESHAFYGCRRLREVILPASIEKIGFEAFKNCPALERVTIPSDSVAVDTEELSACGKARG